MLRKLGIIISELEQIAPPRANSAAPGPTCCAPAELATRPIMGRSRSPPLGPPAGQRLEWAGREATSVSRLQQAASGRLIRALNYVATLVITHPNDTTSNPCRPPLISCSLLVARANGANSSASGPPTGSERGSGQQVAQIDFSHDRSVARSIVASNKWSRWAGGIGFGLERRRAGLCEPINMSIPMGASSGRHPVGPALVAGIQPNPSPRPESDPAECGSAGRHLLRPSISASQCRLGGF